MASGFSPSFWIKASGFNCHPIPLGIPMGANIVSVDPIRLTWVGVIQAGLAEEALTALDWLPQPMVSGLLRLGPGDG